MKLILLTKYNLQNNYIVNNVNKGLLIIYRTKLVKIVNLNFQDAYYVLNILINYQLMIIMNIFFAKIVVQVCFLIIQIKHAKNATNI